jgi:hypothetical protein
MAKNKKGHSHPAKKLGQENNKRKPQVQKLFGLIAPSLLVICELNSVFFILLRRIKTSLNSS